MCSNIDKMSLNLCNKNSVINFIVLQNSIIGFILKLQEEMQLNNATEDIVFLVNDISYSHYIFYCRTLETFLIDIYS